MQPTVEKQIARATKAQIVNHSGTPASVCQDVQPIILAKSSIEIPWTCDKMVKMARIFNNFKTCHRDEARCCVCTLYSLFRLLRVGSLHFIVTTDFVCRFLFEQQAAGNSWWENWFLQSLYGLLVRQRLGKYWRLSVQQKLTILDHVSLWHHY